MLSVLPLLPSKMLPVPFKRQAKRFVRILPLTRTFSHLNSSSKQKTQLLSSMSVKLPFFPHEKKADLDWIPQAKKECANASKNAKDSAKKAKAAKKVLKDKKGKKKKGKKLDHKKQGNNTAEALASQNATSNSDSTASLNATDISNSTASDISNSTAADISNSTAADISNSTASDISNSTASDIGVAARDIEDDTTELEDR
jgi:hypothetical protein